MFVSSNSSQLTAHLGLPTQSSNFWLIPPSPLLQSCLSHLTPLNGHTHCGLPTQVSPHTPTRVCLVKLLSMDIHTVVCLPKRLPTPPLVFVSSNSSQWTYTLWCSCPSIAPHPHTYLSRQSPLDNVCNFPAQLSPHNSTCFCLIKLVLPHCTLWLMFPQPNPTHSCYTQSKAYSG